MSRFYNVTRTALVILSAITAAAVVILAMGGCAGQEASMQGFDLIDSVAANIDTGAAEYHSMRTTQLSMTRQSVAAEFAADVVALAGDKAKVEAKIQEFVTANAGIDTQRDMEQTRANNMKANTKLLRSIANDLRSLNELKLGWKPYIVEYTNRLRAKLAEKGQQ